MLSNRFDGLVGSSLWAEEVIAYGPQLLAFLLLAEDVAVYQAVTRTFEDPTTLGRTGPEGSK